jgi:transitional endoplasmic reticulum ATPase
MDLNVSINFGVSATSDYKMALELAAEFKQFTPAGTSSEKNFIETNNHEILTKYESFKDLMAIIKVWDSTVVYFRNRKILPDNLILGIRSIADCFFSHEQAEDKTAYCDINPTCWGCRHLSGIVFDHANAPYNDYTKYWYQYGSFASKTLWKVDKEEITKLLIEIIEKKYIDFCPVFQQVFFRKILAALPSAIDVTDTTNWGLEYLDTSISNIKRWEPVNVFHKTSLSIPETITKPTKKASHATDGTHKDHKAENANLRFIPNTSFKDVGGIEDVLQNIREIIELPIIKPELFEHLGIKPYRGILLWGEPGNGKTLIAKAIANEVNAHFIPIAGPDILNKSFGESEKNLRGIFEEARECQPSIIFIDEIDAIAQSRLAGDSAKWYATVVNQLLSLMDGIKEFGNVTVMASTNRPDLLDAALLRPGRFDYKLEVRRPNLHGCKTILEIATREMPLFSDVDLFTLAEAVMGYSAAEITFVAKEAAMSALRRNVDIKAILREEDDSSDFSDIVIKQADFFNAVMILKWHSKYVNKTYSIK